MKKKSRLEIGIIMFYLDVQCPHGVNNPIFTQKLYILIQLGPNHVLVNIEIKNLFYLNIDLLIDSALRLIDYHSLSK